MPACHSFNEAQTRYSLIDPQLTKRGWNLSDHRSVSLKILIDGYRAAPVKEITDYCLYSSNGEVLVVIEAKQEALRERDINPETINYEGADLENKPTTKTLRNDSRTIT